MTKRPQNAFQADGNYFQGHHEMKFGYGWRKADVDSSSIVTGPNAVRTSLPRISGHRAYVLAWRHTTSRATGVPERLPATRGRRTG